MTELDKAFRLLEGGYDVHMHATPCLPQRRRTLIEAAQDARAAGMKGIVVKDHHFPTAHLSQIMKEIVPEVDVIGGITLASPVGGINPAAVEMTFKLGGKVVWMFCLESAWMIKKMLTPGFGSLDVYRKLGVKPEKGGYEIFKEPGSQELKDEVKEIICLIKEYNGVLETSHLSPDEGVIVLKEARKQGVKNMVVTHANQEVTYYDVGRQKELAAMGVTMMYSLPQYLPKPGLRPDDIEGLAALVREVGAKNIVLGTDLGQYMWPPVVEGLRMMITFLLEMGISETDVELMVKTNSARIYGGG